MKNMPVVKDRFDTFIDNDGAGEIDMKPRFSYRTVAAILLTNLCIQPVFADRALNAPGDEETPYLNTAQTTSDRQSTLDDNAGAHFDETVGDVHILEKSRPMQGISVDTLDKAKTLYRNLQMAEKAADQHDEINVRLGLSDAKSILDAMYEPSSIRHLTHLTAEIRAQLGKTREPIDRELWLPLQAELDHYRISLPADRYDAAKRAVVVGETASRFNNRDKAQAAVSQVEDIVARHVTLLPLDKIRGDLRAADNALYPDPPYWRGISEAMRSALASIDKRTTTETDSWTTAYLSAVEAIKAIPAEPDLSRQWLRSAAAHLRGLKDGTELAITARRLSESDQPSVGPLYDLIDGIGAHVTTIGSS